MTRHPIDILFDQADMRCTICGTGTKVGCSCWSKCSCGWSYRTDKGSKDCNNPIHRKQRAAS